MKSTIKIFLAVLGLAVFFTACDKAADLAFYGTGTAPVLSASATTVAPAAADSNNVALTLNWTYPGHATDTTNIKYTVEIDTAGKNFSNAAVREVMGGKSLSTSFTAKELNNILLGKGYAFNVPVDMDVKVTSAYANNNERLASNIVRIKMTPYKIPPKVALPASGKLFIVGGATAGGWNNPVPVPSQEFTRVSETQFGGIFQLTGGQSYLLLAINGNWDAKFGAIGANNSNNVNADDFKAGGGDLMSPATSGWYKIMVDFQTGKFTVTPFTQQHGLPSELYVVGDATAGQWNNPVPVPSQRFTRLTSTRFEIASIALTSGKKYLLLPANGSWDRKFGDDGSSSNTKLSGTFKPEGGDFNSPDVSGNYKITIDFINNSYTLTKL